MRFLTFYTSLVFTYIIFERLWKGVGISLVGVSEGAVQFVVYEQIILIVGPGPSSQFFSGGVSRLIAGIFAFLSVSLTQCLIQVLLPIHICYCDQHCKRKILRTIHCQMLWKPYVYFFAFGVQSNLTTFQTDISKRWVWWILQGIRH